MRNPLLRKLAWPAASALVAAAIVLVIVLIVGGGGEEASAQTVRFQQPTEPGPDPFTKPADRTGKTRIKSEQIGQGPFGGTGSDLVCDRELLIKSLRARPERLREWARVAGVQPTSRAVARYIRGLRPVTLTRDTRITNHSFVDGKALGFQAILQAGTAVLVDKSGKPVVRCRCGNPLLEPIYYPEAKCLECPPGYEPPPPCEPYDECWDEYPDPPPIYEPEGTIDVSPPEEPPPPEGSPRPPEESQRPTEEPQSEPQPEKQDICSDGIDNEGVPGLIDSDDPNCQ